MKNRFLTTCVIRTIKLEVLVVVIGLASAVYFPKFDLAAWLWPHNPDFRTAIGEGKWPSGQDDGMFQMFDHLWLLMVAQDALDRTLLLMLTAPLLVIAWTHQEQSCKKSLADKSAV